MAISSPGIGSGLDVTSIVTQLMALERRPLTGLATKEAKFQAQLTAYGSLKGALGAFQSAVAALTDPAKFSAVKTNLADTTVASATASATAVTGSYSIEVQTLAQAHKVKSAAFASSATTVGTGTLTIQFGTYNAGAFTLNPDHAAGTISIDTSKSSLAGVRDAINAADVGVSASIINDGTGNRLVIASKDSGLANALKITVADDDLANSDNSGLSQLVYDASDGGTLNLTQTVAAQNAVAVIDGITISQASNTLTEAIQGVTLNLLKKNVDTPTTLTISRDAAGVQTAVQSFVNAYNELNKTITSLTKFDAVTKQASTLTGDVTVRSIQIQLRSVFNTRLSTAGGGLTMLADIGVTFQADGTLKLDASKLSSVVNDSTKDVSALFAAVGKPTDSLVSFVGSTVDTRNGAYSIDVSQLATRGTALGGSIAALVIATGSNDTLSVLVDDVAASVTLAAGTYTAATLAAEIKSKLNGDPALPFAGVSLDVTEAGGILSITSNRYGAASSVVITGGTAKSDLFGTPIETAGTNVAGTIGGFAATGSGQILSGSGEASGLALTVAGGAIGARGTVNFARGYAAELNSMIGRMLDGGSVIGGRMDGITSSITGIGPQRDAVNRRLESIEARYRAQFSALDVLLSNMSATSNFLTQQLAGLAANNR